MKIKIRKNFTILEIEDYKVCFDTKYLPKVITRLSYLFVRQSLIKFIKFLFDKVYKFIIILDRIKKKGGEKDA